MDLQEKIDAAGNTLTPGPILTTLSTDQDVYVRRYIALNTSTTTEVLITLSTDQDEWVRYYVAGNPSTPLLILTTLSTDPDAFVKRNAKNTIEKQLTIKYPKKYCTKCLVV